VAGGVESGFAHVERDSWPTRLLHVKGRRNVRVLEAPLALSSLNSGDVFLLDVGLVLYQWNGRGASRAEKAKGMSIALAVKDEERGGRAQLHVLAEGDGGAEAAAFFALLGWTGAPESAPVASEEAGGADEAAEAASAPRLYAQPPGGVLTAACEVTQRPLERSLLATGCVCVLVSGGAAYAWVGKAAPSADKAAALAAAAAAAQLAQLPASATHKVVKEGTEPPLFTQAFRRWAALAVPRPSSVSSPTQPRRASELVDVEAMVRSAKAADNQEPDVVEQPGSGELTVWRIEHFEMAPVPAQLYGQFYAGDSYVVLYKYKDASKRDAAFIFFWQGRDSSADERAAAALQAKALDDSMGGYPVQVRVAQGREPAHFHKLFDGRMVVHSGGHPSGFKNVQAASQEGCGSAVALYHVRGTQPHNTHAVQVGLSAASLNSGDCFVLLLPRDGAAAAAAFIWQGRYSSPEERDCAASVAATLAQAFGITDAATAVGEGAEPDAFWAALGGKAPYPACAEGRPPCQAPRLFQLCDAAAGGAGVRCEELYGFGQDDLCDDDVMLLDVTSTVFLWIGRASTANEKAEADALAQRYVASAAACDGRDAETPVVKVCAGEEPAMFTCHFLGWDPKKAEGFRDPSLQREAERAAAEQARQARGDEKAAAAAAKASATLAALELAEAAKAAKAAMSKGEDGAPAAAPAPAGSPALGLVTVAPGSRTYSLEALKQLAGVEGIDLSCKECYLSDAEFAGALGASRADFAKLPKWKQADAKKRAGIF